MKRAIQNLKELTFTAIDFETANENRSSACSFGFAVVEKGLIVKSGSFLIKPKVLHVTSWNQKIHGISEFDLVDAPEFDSIWPQIAYLFETPVVAHNCEFDIDVLKKTAALYNISLPDFSYLCSYKLTQSTFKELMSHKLKDLAHSFGIPLNHHNSHSDAKVCAQITVKALKDQEHTFTSDHPELTYYFNRTATANRNNKEPFAGKKLDSALLKPNLDAADKEHPLYNKILVFTGDLKTISRKDAAAKVQGLGADINTSISKKTQIVVIGEKAGPSKLDKIATLQSQGFPIVTLNEETFLEMIST